MKPELLTLFSFSQGEAADKLPPILFPASVREEGKPNNTLLFMAEEIPLVRSFIRFSFIS